MTPFEAGSTAASFVTPQSRVWRLGWLGELAAAAALLLAVTVLLQSWTGAYNAEFGADNSLHYVTGLFAHDLVAQWRPLQSLSFLKLFFAHYPAIGIGHWPPLFYGLEAVWIGLFSASRTAMMLLSASITAATALACYAIATRWLGRAAAVFVATAFVICPAVQEQTSQLMLDVLVALLCLAAMLSFARYLGSLRLRHALLFGALAGAALMTKGNAGCLALFPPLVIIGRRRFDLLRRPALWAAAALVVVVAGPWYVFTHGMVEAGFKFGWGWTYTDAASVANADALFRAIGPLVLLAGLAGGVTAIVRPRPGPEGDLLVSAVALVAAVWIFQVIVPSGIELRYLIPLLPPLLLLAGWMVREVFRRDTVVALGMGVMFLSIVPFATDVGAKPRLGLIGAAAQAWSHVPVTNPAVLVVADSHAEVAAVAELAMADPHRPSLFAIRGSRLLGGGGYNNQEYVERYGSAAEVMAAIDAYAIPLVIFRDSGTPNEWAHLHQIRDAITQFPERWELLWRDDSVSPPTSVYAIRGNTTKSADVARLITLSGPRAMAE